MSKLSFGTPDKTWAKYGFSENPIIYGKATGYKAILRQDQLVAILGANYALLPNEEALTITNEAAALAGFQPFKAKTLASKITNQRDTQMRLFYTKPDSWADVDGEKVSVGLSVRNSIDGSTGFGIGTFSYRSICSNGVIFGYKNLQQAEGFEQTVLSIQKKHSKGLRVVIENLKNTIVTIMDNANIVLERYNEMAERKATLELIEKLTKTKLPKNVFPATWINPESRTAIFSEGSLTEWNVYNELTAAIWHSPKASVESKEDNYVQLHRIMQVTQR